MIEAKELGKLMDCCSECLTVNRPYKAVCSPSFDPIEALYQCYNCGHEWRCWWSAQAVGLDIRLADTQEAII